MPEDQKEPSRLEKMRAAIRNKPTKSGKQDAKVATVATRKSANPRSAKARDARMKARGRLPLGTEICTMWDGTVWSGALATTSKVFEHTADGHFRLAEELDIMFWNWFAAPGDEAVKAMLTFAVDPPAPAPMPKSPPADGKPA